MFVYGPTPPTPPRTPAVSGPSRHENLPTEVPGETVQLSGGASPVAETSFSRLAAADLAGPLGRYLIDAPQSPRVKELVDSAWSRYSQPAHPLAKARALAKSANQMGGGRGQNWIEQTFGLDETRLTEELRQQPAPPTWSMEEIDAAFAALTQKYPPDASPGQPTITSVKGVGVNYLSDHSGLVEGGFCQLASQYNYLESPGAHTVPVGQYLYDRTQGPQGAVETAAGALHRHAAVTSGALPHALSQVLPESNPSYYQDGYLEVFRMEPAELRTLSDAMKQNLPKFRVLVQPVTAEATHTNFFQVTSAAPSWQGQPAPRSDSLEGQMASMLVVPQYEAIAKLAVMRSLLTGKKTPVHLTLVGQGVFNNPPEVMTEAIGRVAAIVKGYGNVQVFVQSYSSHDPVRRAHQNGQFRLREMDRADFEKAGL